METTESTQARPQRGDELELTIDSLAYGGAGVARLDGYVVFVSGAVPGDRVRAVVGKRKRAYAEARAVEILTPSPERIPPVADHPGAPWQVLPYERQLEVKQAQVDDALRRIGKLDGYELEPIVPAVQQWRYRNKLEYSFGTGPAGELVCGFHAPGRWDEIAGIGDCLLASERANEAREQIVAWCREQGLTAYDRRTGTGELRNLVVREGRRTGALQVRLVTSAGAALDRDSLARAGAELDGLLWTRARRASARPRPAARPSCWPAPSGSRRCSGGCASASRPRRSFRPTLRWPSAFTSSRSSIARPTGFERVYDLYCGIGTLALSIAPRVAEVWGLELIEEAVADAIANAGENQIGNARFYAGDVRLAMRELVEQAGRPDLVVVDPPRAGLSQKVVRRIIEGRAPQRIVYVSSNPDDAAPAPNAGRAAGLCRLRAAPRPPGRLVPADAAHRVRRGAGARQRLSASGRTGLRTTAKPVQPGVPLHSLGAGARRANRRSGRGRCEASGR